MADKKEKTPGHGCDCNCEECCPKDEYKEMEGERDPAEGGESDEEMVNPVQVEKFLKGMDYPVSKQDIIQKAEEEGADENVMETLNKLPERQYNSPVSISKELGKME